MDAKFQGYWWKRRILPRIKRSYADQCTLVIQVVDSDELELQSNLLRWLTTLEAQPAVVVTVGELDSHIPRSEPHWLDVPQVQQHLMVSPQRYHEYTWTSIAIPRKDLRYSSWMKSLSMLEWKNWHIPSIDIGVITHSRPQSLERLLTSLQGARYFGDRLHLRIQMEDSSDDQTLRIVDSFQWEHGVSSVNHRIAHGGLLNAVVESWYPQGNHSYGLLLEDDVELSPLWYAWLKMTLLRYRYGQPENMSPQLFGISLYQQKNLELPPKGRRPFNAQDLFATHELHPATPYLSQIPCSWGAVYFPEHWREFHQYLSLRLSWSTKIEMVQNVRSNQWTRSWKKYFIELVYLRGYVMLYPNFDGFVSLSTNHLEVGSHVKDQSKARKELFTLPLMQLPEENKREANASLPLIQDLPNGTVPRLAVLPVLNLTGSIASGLEELLEIGIGRREALGCKRNGTVSFDAKDLLCIR
ncbi:hypothetical protein C8J56DRAFT_254170, partial [Mycena floridula]